MLNFNFPFYEIKQLAIKLVTFVIMKLIRLIILVFLTSSVTLTLSAQCSICTKTAQQLGDGPAAGMNTGIIYLALVPLAIVGFVGYRWWKNEQMHKSS